MIYITGASGFIGSHLTARFNEYVDIPHEKIQSTDFSKATKVFFLSAYGNMADHTDDAKTLKANVEDLIHVSLSVNWGKVDSFVFVSTSSVKLRTQTMYSRSKKAAEEILLSFMEKYNAPISIIRPFSVTGVGEQPKHLIPTLIRQISASKEVTLDPDPTHDFIDVEDLVNGMLNLSENRAKGIFELGTGTATSNEDVLKTVESVLDKKAKVRIVRGLRPYDNKEWVSTNFKSRRYGWFPEKSLEDSIKEMVNA